MGCGASQAQPTIEISLRNFNRRPAGTSNSTRSIPLPHHVRSHAHKRVTLVWFDPRSVNQDDIIDTRFTKQSLAEAIENAEVEWFAEIGLCMDFLRQQQSIIELVFLVVSGQSSTDLFDQLDAQLLKCIDSIFIFCLDKKRYEPMLLYQKKLIGIYREHNELIQSIQEQIRTLSQEDLITKFYSDTQSTGRIVPVQAPGEFVWMRALKEAILQSHKEDDIKKQMYDRCRILYRRNQTELARIDEFEKTYEPKDAVIWYTRNSFLYRIINQALRTENAAELILFSPYITDLCNILRAERKPIKEMVKFYRGCPLTKAAVEEFQYNVGSLLAINAFFSASCDRRVAELFAACHCMVENTTDVSVIFEIHVDQNESSFVTDITEFSIMQDENEVLFDLNSIFTIQDVSYSDADEGWIIQLIADHATHARNERLYEQVCAQQRMLPPALAITVDLMRIGKTKEAYAYSKLLLQKYPQSQLWICVYGYACLAECDYNQAMIYFKKLYRESEEAQFLHINMLWVHFADSIARVLLALGEWTLGTEYIYATISHIKSACRNSGNSNMFPKYLIEAEMHLRNNDMIGYHRAYVQNLISKPPKDFDRVLSLPHTYLLLAYSLIDVGRYEEALDQLKKAELEGVHLVSAYGFVRLNLHLLYASVYLHQKQFDDSRHHLNEVKRIAQKNLSRSCPSSLACYYLLLELVESLDKKSNFKTLIPTARAAFFQADGFINVPIVAFVLSTICQVHKKERKAADLQPSRVRRADPSRQRQALGSRCVNKVEVSLMRNRSNCLQLLSSEKAKWGAELDKFLIDSFDVCQFDKILEGKTQGNKYRCLLDYEQQIAGSRKIKSKSEKQEASSSKSTNESEHDAQNFYFQTVHEAFLSILSN